jgi:cyclase
VELGAGEIFLTSIDRDGSLNGYELDLCQQVSDNVSVPVLISGGAGNWQHFVDGVRRGHASAVCTSNIYHFTETSLKSAKQFMARAGLAVRV